MTAWKDSTSYQQSDKKREPRSWVMSVAGLRVTVHRHIHYAPTQWLLSCSELGFDMRELKALPANEAMGEAQRLVADALRRRANDYAAAARELTAEVAGG